MSAKKILRFLITAGSTNIYIDKVRVLSNIFKGRTGAAIARYLWLQGHDITLIISDMSIVKEYFPELMGGCCGDRIQIIPYKSFDDLEACMEICLRRWEYDVVIHSAAVSDYRVESTMVEAGGSGSGSSLIAIDTSTKISSEHENLFLKLVPTPKLIGKIRKDWNYDGFVIMFKLQVGITPPELWDIATKRMDDFKANMIVPNLLETSQKEAWIISAKDRNPEHVERASLPYTLYNRIMEEIG